MLNRRIHSTLFGSALIAIAAMGCSSAADSTKSSAAAAGSGGHGGSGAGVTSTGTASASGGGGGAAGADMPTHLPTATGTCPDMANLNGKPVMFAGQAATVWSGDPAKGPGPLLIYYYATGSSAQEPIATIRTPQIDQITALGGAVVAQNKTTAKGATTGNNIWYTGDADIADEIVACSIEKQKIDPRRIHVAGYSAGAIQTTYMWFARSGYVASVLTYSGGEDGLDKVALEDAAHPPAALVTHGAMGKDTFGGIIDFFTASATWEGDIKTAGGFAIDCDDGSTHTDYVTRTKIAPQAVQFFLDHPYGVKPEPYMALPAGWPAYCSIK